MLSRLNNLLETKVKTEDLFSSLNEEKHPIQDNEFKINLNDNLVKIINIFDYIIKKTGKESISAYKIDTISEISLYKLNYSSKEVLDFSLYLKKFEDNDANLKDFKYFTPIYDIFLNKLIKFSNEKEVRIKTSHLTRLINNLGSENHDKTIIIEGKLGDYAGIRMKGGKMIIIGDTGWNLGTYMSGGRIDVYGIAGEGVGYEMKSGEIHLHDDYLSISQSWNHGNIYHKGKLIIPNEIHKKNAKIKWQD